jgi:peptidyl-prolyl cis-trans isomerase C
MIRREAVFAKAKAAGFDQRPDIQESVRRLIAGKFQEEQTKPQGAVEPVVAQQEIEQFYEEHQATYAAPAKARGAILFLKISPLADLQKKEQLMAKAQLLLDQAKTSSTRDFAKLVASISEDQATRYRAGDIGWVSRDTKTWQYDPAVIETLFTLEKPGEFAPLVPSKLGVYIVKLLEKQPAGVRPLAEVTNSIAYHLRKQKLDQCEQDFYASMKAGLDIHINEQMLESMRPPPPPEKSPPATPVAVAQLK